MKRTILLLSLTLFTVAACSVPIEQETTGRAVFTITDAAADMGAVSEVRINVDSVQVHSEAEGWQTVSTSGNEYDLLQLKAEGKQALLADAELKNGTYNRMRLDVSQVVVVDEEGEHEAKLPSGTLMFKGDMVVEGNTTSTASFDFIADESLHVTGNGRYIFAPVVEYESKSDAQVSISADTVVIAGGRMQSQTRVGMDAEGNVGVGVRIPANANLDVDVLGNVEIGGEGNGTILDVGSDVGADVNTEVNGSVAGGLA